MITAIYIESTNQYSGAVYQKKQAGFILNVYPISTVNFCQHMKYFVIRPQSTKILINYDDQIYLHQQSINKSFSGLCSQLSQIDILPEGCENGLINYKCFATCHVLYFEMLKHTYIHMFQMCRGICQIVLVFL